MNDTAKERDLASLAHAAAQDHLLLDARRPLNLDSPGMALRVMAGHVDLFTLPMREGLPDGTRRHLFRVESGGLVLGLPAATGGRLAQRIEVLAVGGQETDALVLDRRGIEELDLIENWIARLSAAAAAGTLAEHEALEAEPGSVFHLEPGERLCAPARGVAWVQIEQGEAQLMGIDVPWRPGDPPLPLAAGTWLEGIGQASLAVLGRQAIFEPWPAIDRFHHVVMLLLAHRVAQQREAEEHQFRQRMRLAAHQSERLYRTLAGVIVPRRPSAPRGRDNDADPLLAACRLVGDALGVPITQPLPRQIDQQSFAEAAKIARASRLRVRRILLRGEWWRGSGGPFIAWHGEARRPVAIVPISPRRYVMMDPKEGTRRQLDTALAAELSPEAASLYEPLPARAIGAADLLRHGLRRIRSDTARMRLASLALGAFAMATPIVTQILIDSVIPRSDLTQLALCAAALAMVALGTAAFQAVQGIAFARIEGLLDWALQAAIIDRLLRLPAKFFTRYTAGDLTDRTLGIEAMRQVFTGRTMGGMLSGVSCLYSLALMFYYDPRLALVALAITVVHGVIIIAVNARRLSHERLQLDAQGRVEGLVLQFITGIGKLRVAGASLRALEVWARAFADQKRHFIASQRAANLLNIVESGYSTAATLVIFAVAARSGLALGTGQFLAFFVAFGQSLAAMSGFGVGVGESLIAWPLFSRLRPLLVEPTEHSEQRNAPGTLSGAVELGQVTFRYAADGPAVLNKVSIRARKGEYVALVGPSGSGKSTIFRLLLGFEQPESGTVLFDGQAIESLDMDALRRQIGVVLQNGKLTSGSIYENICGGVTLPIGQAWEAAKLAGLDAEIEAMPMGMHTVISEGMSTISGGQRQRLMIARALVHRPRIVLFDEATSALDNRTQSIVSASLAKLNVTRLIIAHRLSTVQNADRIVVLVNGAVVQSGNFAELTAGPGAFADLAKRQLL